MKGSKEGRHNLRHRLTLLSGLLESLFIPGIAYGWASLVYVLKVDQQFSGYCINTTRVEDGAVHIDCRGQDEQFTRVMYVAFFINALTRLPIGLVFDRCGTLVIRLIAIAMFTAGTLFIALLNTETSFLLYPAWPFIITSGSIFHFTNIQMGNLLESYRSTVITVYNGAFDSSAGVCLIIKLLFERGVSLRTSFLCLALCSIALLMRTLFLMPRGNIPYPLPENFTYGLGCPGKGTRRRKEEHEMKEGIRELEAKKNQSDEKLEDAATALHLLEETSHDPKRETEPSFQSCLFSGLLLWHMLWMVTMMFSHGIFLANVNPMLIRLAGNDQNIVSHYTNAFALIQLCGVLFAPINGLIMDRHKRRPLPPGKSMREADLHSSVLTLFLTSLECFLLCVCSTFPVLPLQYLSFFLQVLNSSSFYAGHFSFIGFAFPVTHFGKLSGTVMSSSALVLLLQFPIQHLIQNQLHGDPLYVNVSVTLLSLLAFGHPLHVGLYCRKLAEQKKTKEEGKVSVLQDD